MPPASTGDAKAPAKVLLIGGSGRLGRLLRHAWKRRGGQRLIWQSRSGQDGVQLDPLADPAGYARAAAGADVIFNLAGVTTGDCEALAVNRELALAAIAAARAAGVRRVFLASSAAVYGRAGTGTREDTAPQPISDYGRAKRTMEEAVLDPTAGGGALPRVTCLRIGNVAGADQLLGATEAGEPQFLDICADGRGPRRSYIGPQALAGMLEILFALARDDRPLPPILNVALAGAVRMEALLDADGRCWHPRPASAEVIPELCLDTALLARVIGVPGAADAAAIVADFRSLVPRRSALDLRGRS